MREYRLIYDAHGGLQISDHDGLLGFVITAQALAGGISPEQMAEHLRELDNAVQKLSLGSGGKRAPRRRR